MYAKRTSVEPSLWQHPLLPTLFSVRSQGNALFSRLNFLILGEGWSTVQSEKRHGEQRKRKTVRKRKGE